MKKLRDSGRNENESSESAALGFVEDDDYDGALLVDGGVVHSKGWVIDSGCSFHICCEKEKFTKLSYGDYGLVTLPNDEKVKVTGIGEVMIETHGGVKRRLGDVRYVPKFERNLISLGRLESKGCTFKASGGVLKVIRRSMVLMKGVRSKRNLYELQVDCGSLGHKSENGVVFGSKRITFEDDKSIKLEGEIVKTSVNIHMKDVNLNHIIEHALSCTLEDDGEDLSSCVGLRFGTIDEVINVKKKRLH